MVDQSKLPSLRDSLGAHGMLPEVLNAWDASGIKGLLPIQSAAIAAGCLDGKSCVIVGPTSCGKTFVGEIVAVRHATHGRRCIYLVPFKALAEEKYAEFARKYARPDVGARVVISTADRRDTDRRIAQGDFDLAILTYEKLSSLLVTSPTLPEHVGVVVIDEAQMVGDQNRGTELELLLTRIRQVAPTVQLVALSAVMSDLAGFDHWLGAITVRDDYRPVPLREGVLQSTGHFEYVEWIGAERKNGNESLVRFSSTSPIQQVAELMGGILKTPTEQVLVFADTIRKTKDVAEAIAQHCGFLPAAPKVKAALGELEDTESVSALLKVADRSVAFHNADLTLSERQAVEAGFRSGELRCLVSTTTLSMGVNLPASTVVIPSVSRRRKNAAGVWGEERMSVAEYRNMSGRAGRFGVRADSFGRSILVAQSPMERTSLLNTYVSGAPGPMKSTLFSRPLEVQVLKIIASGLCNTADGVRRFLKKSFAASLLPAKHFEERVGQPIDDSVSDLLRLGLVARDRESKLIATPLGRICAASGFDMPSFALLMQLVDAGTHSELDIACTVSQMGDAGPDATNLWLSTEELAMRTPLTLQDLRNAANRTRSPIAQSFLDRFSDETPPDETASKAIKFMAIAADFVGGVSSKQIERDRLASAGKTRAVGSSCAWACDTLARIAWQRGRADAAKSYERLADRFYYGCSEQALLFAHLSSRTHRADRERLVQAGYTTLQQLIDVPPEDVARQARVSRSSVLQLQQAIIDALGESLNVEKQQIARLRRIQVATKLVEELYTAKGVVLEQALEEILCPPFCSLTVTRFGSQKHGEADLKVVLSNGRNGIVQVNARDMPTEKVSPTKAGSVLQQCPELKPEVFICIGRPDFHEDAIRNSAAHANAGRNYKIIPVSVIAEMYVRFREGTLTPTRVVEILEIETGYITLGRL